MKKYTRRSAEQWQELVNEQLQSDLSAPQFCQQHGIGYPSFCAWRKRLSSSEPRSTPVASFVELTPSTSNEVQTGQQWNVELELGSGLTLRIAKA